jgi:hypothetical protein
VIDRLSFAKVMGGFADRVGRALAPETAEMYYDVLSSALTTTEFLAGARIVFRSHAYNTWPAPQQFIAAAKPEAAAKLTGSEVFEKVLALTNDPRITDHAQQVAALGPIVERAYRAAGGYREFRDVLEADVKWIRKLFVENYELAESAALREQDAALSLSAVDGSVAGLIEHVAAARSLPAPKVFPLSGRDRAAGTDRD